MKHLDLEELYQLEKRLSLSLTELWDLTRQLAEAADRNDQVSVKLVLTMRQEPLSRMEETDAALRARLGSLPQERAIRLGALLNGGAAREPEEEPLRGQVERNRRLLEKIVELDRRVSRRLGGRQSFYDLYREPESGA